jgi:hypothetical protein
MIDSSRAEILTCAVALAGSTNADIRNIAFADLVNKSDIA